MYGIAVNTGSFVKCELLGPELKSGLDKNRNICNKNEINVNLHCGSDATGQSKSIDNISYALLESAILPDIQPKSFGGAEWDLDD